MSLLAIDFAARPPRRLSLVGALLLLTGAAALSVTYADLTDAEERLAAAESRLRALTRGSGAASIAAVPSARQAGGAPAPADPGGGILRQLRSPWPELLAELELTSDLPVALLALDAEAKSRRLRLSAEAKTMDDVLAFVERLRQSKRLAEVFLLHQEERKVGAVSVIAFTVQAAWPESLDPR